MPTHRQRRRYVLCLSNDGCEASLVVRKVYVALSDPNAKQGLLRVVDETGDDCLYPRSAFAPLKLSASVEHALAQG